MKATILFIAALCSCGAMAAEPPIRTEQDVHVVFESLDRNRDQRISKSEAAKERTLRRRFAGVDSDGDGFLSKAEFEARPSAEPFE